MNIEKQPTRQAGTYHELERSVTVNIYKREKQKKKEHVPGNMLAKFLAGRILLWIISYVKYRFWFKHRFFSYEGIPDRGVYPLVSASGNEKIALAVAADWGTDTEESKAIGLQMLAKNADYTIHLGDTYFVGDHKEVRNNFDPNNSFWPYGQVGSFALPGNHEMYSNGYGYFNTLLPWMGVKKPMAESQKASYFCLQNEHWQIIGLDTGYRSVGIPLIELLFSKADLRPEVITWLKKDVKEAGATKGIILLTHHQYTSAFDKTYPATARQLKEIFGNKVVLWFWGHEHRLALYGHHKDVNGIAAYGRCIGHGGMPVSLVKANAKRNPNSNLVIYDNRDHQIVCDTMVGHNGYALLEFEGRRLTVSHYDETQLLLTEHWECDEKGELNGISIVNHCPDLEKWEEQELEIAIGLSKNKVLLTGKGSN